MGETEEIASYTQCILYMKLYNWTTKSRGTQPLKKAVG